MHNIAIIAHVDHGKTTLVDRLLEFCQEKEASDSRIMDSMALEMERGVTIKSKVTSVTYGENRINILDTPGHADFGGEVERAMGMVDGVILLVDAFEGVMTQTKFVLGKALKAGCQPIVVINKIDKDDSRVNEVEDEILELFINLDATEQQLDFPFLYASSKNGWVANDMKAPRDQGMKPLLEAVVNTVPKPKILDLPDFSMVVSMIGYDQFVGRLVTGKIMSGTAKVGDAVHCLRPEQGSIEKGKITKLILSKGTKRIDVEEASAGHIVTLAGIDSGFVADSITGLGITEPLDSIPIDPPTLSMTFFANTSPLQGKEGSKLTGQQIVDRLKVEVRDNVSISLKPITTETCEVFGRGELQLGVLIETMRREGFELSVSPPAVVMQERNGQIYEPVLECIIDIEDEHQGSVMDAMTKRLASLQEMTASQPGRTKMTFKVPTRCLVGYQCTFTRETHGTGIMYSTFLDYEPHWGQMIKSRKGVLIASAPGTATAYALASSEARGELFVKPGDTVYAGMIVGEHSRETDLEVNPCKAKQLTNMRAAGNDETIKLTPPRLMTLEDAIGYVLPDELIEVTPASIRLRKKILDSGERKRAERKGKNAG